MSMVRWSYSYWLTAVLLTSTVPLSVCCGALATTSLAQAPGKTTSPDPVDEIEQGKPVKKKTAKQQAQRALGEKQWSSGYDANTGRIIQIESAMIAAGPDDPESFGDARAAAYEEAMLKAKKLMAEAMALQISASVESTSMFRKGKGKKKKPAGNNPPEAPGMVEKLSMLANSYLDDALNAKGIDPSAATASEVEEVAKEVKRSKEFKSSMSAAARAELAGVFAYKIFEEVSPGKNGHIAVIAMSTPKSRQMAKAMLGSEEAPQGKAKSSTYSYLDGEGDALIYAFGVRPRTNEHGELCLLAFGQSTAEEDDEFAFEGAEQFAEAAAKTALRLYAGEAMVTQQDATQNQSLKTYADKSKEYNNDAAVKTRIQSVADRLSLPGMTPIYSAQLYHELCDGAPTAIVVYEYKLSSARALAELAREFGAVGGSKGVFGLTGDVAEGAASGSESAPGARGGSTRGGTSGSSSAADDDASSIADDDASSIDVAINLLIKRSGRMAMGHDDAIGDYIIASIKIRNSWGDDAIAQARQAARDTVAQFFGAQLSGSSEATHESETRRANGKTESTFKKSFKSVSRTEVDQYLRGLGLDRVADYEGSQYAVFILSEYGMEHSASLAEAVRSIGHEADADGTTTVTAVGMAVIRNDDIPAARGQAVQQAQREALEKVIGMVVVGLTQANRESGGHQQFRESVFSNTEGFIEDWEAVEGSDGPIGDHYRIVIQAIVTPNKLYDNYRTHLQSMGDPTFAVQGGEKEVRERLQQFFRDKGFRIVEGKSDWVIEIASSFRTKPDRKNPARTVTLLDMSFQMRNTATGHIIGPVEGPRRFNSRLTDPTSARREALDKGFAKWKDILHKKINDEIVRMAREGRPVKISFADWPVDIDTTTQFEALLQTLPGVNGITRSINDGDLVFEIRYVGDAAFLQGMIVETSRSVLSDELMDQLTLSNQGNDLIAFSFPK
jgi:hypothetical protein